MAFLLLLSCSAFAQDVSLFQQFNGRFDFVFVGNTLNTSENNLDNLCEITTASSATLTLNPDDEIEKAFLYWAGSGPGDFEVLLNGSLIVSERNFSIFQNNLIYFSAFADVTNQIISTGNGTYLLSDLDVSPFLSATAYCNNRTNFAGWTLVIVYKNENLPLNQLNLYDGLQGVSRTQQNLTLTLSSLNVIDNLGSKIGFVAWEGDDNLPEENSTFIESLTINNNVLSNTLNPPNNPFNGTNSFTGRSDLYNMDLDVYDIQDYISVGDQSATIRLTSQQDFVMISTVVTKLNSQLPDASITIDQVNPECNSREILVNYTVYNLESTNILRSGVPIAVYANDILIGNTVTTQALPIGGSYSTMISLPIPEEIPDDFRLKFVVDDLGTGIGIVTEISETNNDSETSVSLLQSPQYNSPEPLLSCNEGAKKGTFDFSSYADLVKTNAAQEVFFYESYGEAVANINPILNTSSYEAPMTPIEIFIRLSDENCFAITSFVLKTKNCKPTVYNAITPNNDMLNDSFFIEGLRNIFTNFKLHIYNRWGTLIWKGDNNSNDWAGEVTEGISVNGNQAPDGTYYYILELNDPDFPKPLTGWIYLAR